jgi:hypothetical protein
MTVAIVIDFWPTFANFGWRENILASYLRSS